MRNRITRAPRGAGRGRDTGVRGCVPQMLRSRVRWRNVARAGTIGAGTIGAIAALPMLLEAPDPGPLPADVGLDSGATGARAFVSADDGADSPAHASMHGAERRPEQGKPGRRQPASSTRDGRGGADERAGVPDPQPGESTDRELEPASVAPPPPAAAPAAGPEPIAAAPPAPVSPPSRPPDPPPAPETASSAQDGHAQVPPGPSQFGFEQ